LDCCFNLVEDVFVASEQGKREFLVGIVAPKLFRVGRYADGLGMVLQGIVFHVSHVTQKACPQSQEFVPMKRQFRVRHFVEPSKKYGGTEVPSAVSGIPRMWLAAQFVPICLLNLNAVVFRRLFDVGESLVTVGIRDTQDLVKSG